jgi:hypothetical protein
MPTKVTNYKLDIGTTAQQFEWTQRAQVVHVNPTVADCHINFDGTATTSDYKLPQNSDTKFRLNTFGGKLSAICASSGSGVLYISIEY